jgi:hypothetical protein
MSEQRAAAALVEDCMATIDRLRQSWEWLGMLVEPGRESSVGSPVDDARAEALAVQALAARADKEWNLRQGNSALPPAAAPARLGIVDAGVHVHGLVLDVARMVAASAGAVYVGARVGADAVIDALDWLELGSRPDPWVVGAEGVRWRESPLDRIRDAGVAASVDRQLARADQVARAAARVLDDTVQPINHRCPACRQRSLQLHYDPADLVRVADGGRPARTARWYVECVSERCRCTVEGCGCRMRHRYTGRRHAWAYGELGDLWAAIAAVGAQSERLRAGGTGRGWR